MKKTKVSLVVASALASIVVCVAMIAGATFALFTDKDGVNIAVTSGTVEVTAEIDQSSLKLASMGEELDGKKWAAGGTAEFVGKSTLNLNNILPGDSATFNVKIANHSSVDVLYRVAASVSGELKSALDILYGAVDSTWTLWTAGSDKEKTVSVSVELPEEVGNEYQNKSASIEFAVEALQGNAKPESNTLASLQKAMEDGVYTADGRKAPQGMKLDFSGEHCVVRLENEEAMLYYGHYFDRNLAYEARQADIAEGLVEKTPLEKKYFAGYNIWYAASYGPKTYVSIENDMDFESETWEKPLSFYGYTILGNDHTVRNVKVVASGDAGQAGLFNLGNTNLENLYVTNVYANAENATGSSCSGTVASVANSIVRNVTVDRSYAIGGKYSGGLVGYGYTSLIDNKISDVSVVTSYKGGGIVGFADASTDKNKITGNYLNNVTVKCENLLAGKVANLGAFIGNLNHYYTISGNVAKNADQSVITVSNVEKYLAYDNVINGVACENTVPAQLQLSGAVSDTTFSGLELNKLSFAADSVLENVTFDGATLTANDDNKAVGLDVSAENLSGNLTFKNCTFSGYTKDVQVGGSNSELSLTFENCSFNSVAGNSKSYGFQGFATYKNLTIKNCTFNDCTSWAILVQGNFGEGHPIVIFGNTFENCKSGIYKTTGSVYDFEFSNNKIINCLGHDGVDTYYFAFAPVLGGTVVAEGNVDENGNAWNAFEHGVKGYKSVGNYAITSEESLQAFCADCANYPDTDHAKHTQFLKYNNGVAEIPQEGAWVNEATDFAANSAYVITYKLNVAALTTEGAYLAFDSGETAGWQNVPFGVCVKDGKKYIYAGLTPKGDLVEVGDELSVEYTYTKSGNDLKFVVKVNGTVVSQNSTAYNEKAGIYWNIYHTVGNESGVYGEISDFAVYALNK